ncbi:MAG: type II CRISPR RNA-guided endonuclease Cas9 [Bacteroidetes bacterium]|nr:type II CRISPR RNA-guided endonuclease Cas9 [Bacteroidota bacterium]MBS1541476.1 type II CRISPR RNA-guided endonuclease Cas9 [Bacteroidota bacterium]
MKKVLGLDLGTTSIGWALVNEAENNNETSSIIKLGVRVNPLTVDEQQNFEKGKSITTNADRTLKRSMRRNLQRYKLRRENLIEILKEHQFISSETILSENGNRTTFETYRLRAKSATEKISLEEFARVLLMINKKRGYKSSRKAKGTEEGSLIDGMEIAKKLYNENLTPGQFCLQLIVAGKKYLPDFYRSDLQAEFDKIFDKQLSFHSEILSLELKEELRGKKRDAVWAICAKAFKEKGFELVGKKRQGKADEQKKENYAWRANGLTEKLDLEKLVIVLQQINVQLNSSSGYLGAISDRSKELFFNIIKKEDGTDRAQTVGEYQMSVLGKNPNASLRNMVFYRQDYLDEFNAIWDEQAKHHKELTEKLKTEIRDVIIFYQRRLKSQKGLISFCEFESRQIEVLIDGKKKTKTVGNRVIPRSSPLFQEFKIWQVVNNVEVYGRGKKSRRNTKESQIANQISENERRLLHQEEKEILAAELSIKPKITKIEALNLLFENPKELDFNFKEIQGNITQAKLFEAYQKIIEVSGHELDLNKPAEEILNDVSNIFKTLGFNTDILQFDSAKPLDEQEMYKLWHVLYSFEGDNSNTGNEKLINKLMTDFGFDKVSASILSNVNFLDDYGSLSAKAIRKILPHLKEGNQYNVACEYAGYRHSKSSLEKEEIENKVYKDRLEILAKNSLRNPVVEKILNQMINVINTIIETYGKPEEIRIELARELKKNAEERKKLTEAISKSTDEHEIYRKILTDEKGLFRLKYISRNDIIRYKLYDELKDNGYKTLYSNTYIEPGKLFSKEFDIEHIIPQARLFDDSFSNKTLEVRNINIEKGNKTAYDFVKEKYGETGSENSLDKFLVRMEDLYKKGVLKRTKYNKLKMSEKDIPEGFINRDLGNTQYIAKYAKTMLGDLVKFVVSTTGTITDRLREDWQLVDVMKELNWEKYNTLGLTEVLEKEDYEGNKIKIRRIKDWTKRNDHRHHAMDALTVAFTKRQHVQYLNNLNARSNKGSEIYGIEQNELYRNDKGKLLFKPPFALNEFRIEAKKHLENTLISIKAKNKVATKNINTTKKKGGANKKVQLTPRGQLHLETVYGSLKQYASKEEKVGTTFDEAKILTVSRPAYREALLKRLRENANDPKKAFSGKNAPTKNPIYIDEARLHPVPEKVKTVTLETAYTIRKEITPDLFKDAKKKDIFEKALTETTNLSEIEVYDKAIDFIFDKGIRNALIERYKKAKQEIEEYNKHSEKKNQKKVLDTAFSNIGENPIYLKEVRDKNGQIDKTKSIEIKRVTISGISNAEALHSKKDKNGNLILDENGNEQAVDFVNTGGNHHVAVYRDAEGNLQENVISFYEAIARKNAGLPIIDKTYKQSDGWQFLFSMKQNEYFVFPNEKTGFNPKDFDLLNPDNYSLISPNLFRVQKLATKDYFFRHHLETSVESNNTLKGITWIRAGLSGIEKINKIRVNHIGQIVSVGEY